MDEPSRSLLTCGTTYLTENIVKALIGLETIPILPQQREVNCMMSKGCGTASFWVQGS